MSSDLAFFWRTMGGPAQGVVVLLGLMSFVSVAIVVERELGLWMDPAGHRPPGHQAVNLL